MRGCYQGWAILPAWHTTPQAGEGRCASSIGRCERGHRSSGGISPVSERNRNGGRHVPLDTSALQSVVWVKTCLGTASHAPTNAISSSGRRWPLRRHLSTDPRRRSPQERTVPHTPSARRSVWSGLRQTRGQGHVAGVREKSRLAQRSVRRTSAACDAVPHEVAQPVHIKRPLTRLGWVTAVSVIPCGCFSFDLEHRTAVS